MEQLLKKLYYLSDTEIIIMDNGSNDNTPEIIKKYIGKSGIKIITNKKHIGLNGFKKLFKAAKGDYIIAIDDDVLEFPPNFDKSMVEYMQVFKDYGYLALNVVQNEFTNGAKPDSSAYIDEIKENKIVQKGPTGGWCSVFRKSDFKKVRFRYNLTPLSLRRTQDGVLAALLARKLQLKSGIIKNEMCFHASGPYYASKFNHLEHEIKKYERDGLTSFVEHYKSFRKEGN